MKDRENIYFASDVHLGAPSIANHKEHEQIFVSWLNSIKDDARAIFLMGDIFDFWYEYKHVVPRGYVRLFGILAELADSGIDIHFFVGNHDIWTFGYFQNEIGMHVHYQPEVMELLNKRFFLAHGDGLGDPNKSFKLLKKVFHNKLAQKLFSFLIHPDCALSFGKWWSGKSRKSSSQLEYGDYMGEDKEHLIQFSKDYIGDDNTIDFFIFGHRHIPLDFELQGGARVIILGDWIHNYTYGVWNGQCFKLETFEIKT